MCEWKHILQCEDSIEGIFTGVYEAWRLKYGHDNTTLELLERQDTPQLFAEYSRIVPDPEKAYKVLRTIREKGSGEIYRRLFYAACAGEADKADVIYRYFQVFLRMGNGVLNHLTNPAVVRIMELCRAVGNEEHHYRGFLRFIEIPDRILFARFEPKHDLVRLLMPHFEDRLPEERFIIWDVGRNLAGFHIPGKEVVYVYLDEEEKERMLSYTEDNMDAENLWRAFTRHISIKERENRALQRNNIPLHFRTFMPEFKQTQERD